MSVLVSKLFLNKLRRSHVDKNDPIARFLLSMLSRSTACSGHRNERVVHLGVEFVQTSGKVKV